MQFEAELARVLPSDIPRRDHFIAKAAQHLSLIGSANERMNLTRITDPREAAIKHVYDSVAPWRYFEGCKEILDAGTGAGFPGIPLALLLPETRFTLSESVQKKARFVNVVVEQLALTNVHVVADRAEKQALAEHRELIIARAVAPIGRVLDLFALALNAGTRVILYKGPNVHEELVEAQKRGAAANVLYRYELPDGLGHRTLIELRSKTGRSGVNRMRPAR